MARKGPGKAHRKGISVLDMAKMFATEADAAKWFEAWYWPDGKLSCLRCGCVEGAYRVRSGKPMPFRCRTCRRYFSLKTGTAMEDSKLPLQKWAWAIYMEMTNLKGVSSMKLHRDLDISQPAAWFMLHRIRTAFADTASSFSGPVEVDETYVGGLRKNMSNKRREDLKGTGRGAVGKTTVVGMKDRETGHVAARVIDSADGETLRGFVDAHAAPDAALFTDDATAYKGTGREHETVKHSAAEYVRYLENATVHTNGVESLWSMLKRAHKGVYHRLSPKHLQRYVDMFAGRQNVRTLDTLAQIQAVVMGMVGRRLMYRDLVADNGREAVAG